MARRVKALALAGGVAAVAVLVAVAVAVSGGGDGPRALPVLGLGAGGAAGEAATVADDDSAASLMRVGGIRYEVVGELGDITGDAGAWSTRSGDPTDALSRLADALGIDGSVERTDYGWALTDGRRRLEVHDVPGLPWSFWEESVEVGGEGVVTSEPVPPEDGAARDEPVSSETTTETMIAEPPPEPERPADLPTREEAVGIALDLMRGAGVDTDHADVRVDDNFTVWSVTAAPVVGGVPSIGMETSVSVGSGGAIAWANGWLGALSRGDDYPLIGTTAALDRLIEQGGGGVTTMAGDAAETMIAECPPEADCIEPEPVVVQVTGVRIGLLFMPFFGGEEAWLVPAYLFELDGGQGGEAPVVGVPDDYLVEPPATEPVPSPEPMPVEPDGGAGGSEPGYPGP